MSPVSVFAAVAAVAGLATAARWPQGMGFLIVATADAGANLNLAALIDRGGRPMVDFGYAYGLLPAALGDLWFRLFGRTALAFTLFGLACNVAVAASIARYAVATRVRASGLAWVVVSSPFTVVFPQAHFAHALEPALMALALAEHARGRRPAALAVLTLCCLTKPALAYFYGLLLLILTLRALAARGAPAVAYARALGPAAACGLAAAAVLGLVHGPTSLVRTTLPMTGMATYRLNRNGFFFGTGRQFWAPSGRTLNYYLGTVTATWLVATAFLAVAVASAARRWFRKRYDGEGEGEGAGEGPDRWRDETILACGLIHLVFVTLAWGNAFCWYYYFYAVVLGVAAATSATASPTFARLTWGLVPLALLGTTGMAREAVRDWRERAPSPVTAGLWATTAEEAAWSRVMAMTRGLRPVVLLPQGGGIEQIFPGMGEPEGMIYNLGITMPAEVERKALQIEASRAVIAARGDVPHEQFLAQFPPLRDALTGFERVDIDDRFIVYLRRDAPPPGRGRPD